jgi:hypothetical protein
MNLTGYNKLVVFNGLEFERMSLFSITKSLAQQFCELEEKRADFFFKISSKNV